MGFGLPIKTASRSFLGSLSFKLHLLHISWLDCTLPYLLLRFKFLCLSIRLIRRSYGYPAQTA